MGEGVTSALRIMSDSDTLHQSQQSGTPVNNGSTNTNYTSNNGCMLIVNGGTLNNVQITNSYHHPVNEVATGGSGVDDKCPDANDGIDDSDFRGKVGMKQNRWNKKEIELVHLC